jgi:hypothetical protein
MFEEKVFWKEGFGGKVKGGLMFRSFDLSKFLKKVENQMGEEIVGFVFEDNNLNILINDNEKVSV